MKDDDDEQLIGRHKCGFCQDSYHFLIKRFWKGREQIWVLTCVHCGGEKRLVYGPSSSSYLIETRRA